MLSLFSIFSTHLPQMNFYCIKLSGLYKLFQTSGNFTKFRQGNQGNTGIFFWHLAGNPVYLLGVTSTGFTLIVLWYVCLYYSLRHLGDGGVNLMPPPPLSCSFLKIASSKERVKPWFFVTFNIILRHIFPENFIEFPQVVQKIWRNYLVIVANFHRFFWFFDITLLQRN